MDDKSCGMAMRRVRKRFEKALKQYSLIADGDKILVGLSGGKDSLLLLDLLADRSRVFKPRFTVGAIHVRMENISYESDTTYLEQFCQSRGVALHVATTSFDPESDRRKQPCFLCSWYRRKQLFAYAQDSGYNKIALGHHQDDVVHTALMNLLYEGRFASMPPKLEMRKMPLTIIRPLILVEENDIVAIAEAEDYKKQNKQCPYEKATRRSDIAALFRRMEELNPEARYSIVHALDY